MKRRWRLFILPFALVLLLGLAYLNRAFFFTYLVEPIARILWLIYRTFLSVNQQAYWTLLILGAFIAILRIFPAGRNYHHRLAYRNHQQVTDRVSDWENLLASAVEDENSRLALQRELETLQQSIGALAEGTEESIQLPPVKKNWQTQAVKLPQFLSRLTLRRIRREETELEKQVEIVLEKLETQLETHHDRKSNHPNDD